MWLRIPNCGFGPVSAQPVRMLQPRTLAASSPGHVRHPYRVYGLSGGWCHHPKSGLPPYSRTGRLRPKSARKFGLPATSVTQGVIALPSSGSAPDRQPRGRSAPGQRIQEIIDERSAWTVREPVVASDMTQHELRGIRDRSLSTCSPGLCESKKLGKCALFCKSTLRVDSLHGELLALTDCQC